MRLPKGEFSVKHSPLFSFSLAIVACGFLTPSSHAQNTTYRPGTIDSVGNSRNLTLFRGAQIYSIGLPSGVRREIDGADADPKPPTQIVDFAPFTHIAYIPAGADISSIRFKGIKAVKIATRQRSVSSLSYCEERLRAAEPGGSMYCPLTTDESAVPAYKVTYTFTAPPIPSDEYGGRSFTFDVYFRPDELSPSLRKALTSSRVRRTDLSEYFKISAYRESVEQIVVDPGNSTVCDGNYVDGDWVKTNRKCHGAIAYKRVASASPYIAVRIDPAPRLEATVGRTR